MWSAAAAAAVPAAAATELGKSNGIEKPKLMKETYGDNQHQHGAGGHAKACAATARDGIDNTDRKQKWQLQKTKQWKQRQQHVGLFKFVIRTWKW